MNKEKVLKEIAAASAAGNINEVLELTKLLSQAPQTTEAEPVKRKRGRPKKIKQEENVIVEDEPEIEVDDEDEDGEIDEYEIEDDDEVEDEPAPKKKKSKKKDAFLAQFEVKQKLNQEKNTGIRLSWKKPKSINFFDDPTEFRHDAEIDKKLKVQENVPRDRPKVTKKKVPCCMCGEKFSVYSNNIHYMYDDEKRKNVIVPMRCSSCYGEK